MCVTTIFSRTNESLDERHLVIHKAIRIDSRRTLALPLCLLRLEPIAMIIRRLKGLLRLVGAQSSAFADRYFWHTSNDRYVLFLAEYFLRRTNRSTVSRNLRSFPKRYPNPDALTIASSAEVIKEAHWAGLRKRTSHLPQIVGRLWQKASWTSSELQALPHIGKYAADGIALYVFEQPEFPIDNNVKRVIGRYFGTETSQDFDRAARAVHIASLRAGSLEGLKATHMGILDIGWMWCKAKPKCDDCPLRSWCAHRNEQVP